jgi:hypothetical protein
MGEKPRHKEEEEKESSVMGVYAGDKNNGVAYLTS